jgi:sensor histidine kinase regulating citrate/malate metabolism
MEKDNKFKTSQPDTAIHGIGLKNVKNIVAKEEGELNISYTKERFKVEVMMYLPEKV